MSTLVIPRPFNGPVDSANGGVSAGLVAALVATDEPVTVTLRLPPPLDVPMVVERSGTTVQVRHGDRVVAEAVPGGELGEAIPAVSFDEAVAASKHYAGFAAHPYPTCFACGTARPDHDGLEIFPGPVGGDPACTAAPFVPRRRIPAELMWAALDCPGGWTVDITERPAMLGRMSALIRDLPSVGEECVVVGQLDVRDRRKAFSRTAAYGADGRLLGRAAAVWIELVR